MNAPGAPLPHIGVTSRRRTIAGVAVRAVAAAVLGIAFVAGCSAPGAPPSAAPPAATTSAPPATYSADLCDAATQFQTSANAIVQLDATTVGAEGVKTALQNLADAAQALVTAAESQFAPQVAELEQTLGSLQTTITGISDETTLSAKLGALTASVAQVEAAAKPIVDSVRNGCTGVPTVETPPTS